jgi:hypothetical protein
MSNRLGSGVSSYCLRIPGRRGLVGTSIIAGEDVEDRTFELVGSKVRGCAEHNDVIDFTRL